ncbi:MAG: RNA polymerase factor sigma-54 [Alphaproteobacteria bacterium]|jgi:RNA polymerase sigma-54 factor|nr:RNA polymerase sigma-54 factor [Rhodospirillaceae bacterium]MDP6405738.1 RNA polymerase factor sigma-54 [Alphaproteobacteria bacterium]MDP6621917.1 RNA polymerase factor sigma-54 [Alphaproteobacteria bacterium]|tara:strand:- start:65 stop:1687 length:1623 start_codon:yes stop_codon:yes gene_type:complete
MSLSPKLEVRQSQNLVMTPQLQQAIKLLQLSNLELMTYVEQEVEQNPMLEQADPNQPERGDGPDIDHQPQASTDSGDGGDGDGDGGDGGDGSEASDKVAEGAIEVEQAVPDTADFSGESGLPKEDEAPLDVDLNEAIGSEPTEPSYTSDAATIDGFGSSQGGRTDFSDSGYTLEQNASEGLSLTDHLLEQLNVDVVDTVDRMIGVHLIDAVDDAGYLTGDLDLVAEMIGCSRERVDRTLEILKGFDPSGAFAGSLAECLALQLADLDRLDPAMEIFVNNLDLLAKHDLGALARLCNVDAEDIADMISEIRALDPKPGLRFGSEIIQAVVPDVFVRPSPSGGWHIELNGDTLPKVLVNMQYHATISGRATSSKDKAYISERLNSANWLVKSLDQRANTILKVATELVRQQDGFLAHGIEYLKPLNLRDIAGAIDMHESTVSRVTANKYLSTPRGIYPMKYFFTSAISSAVGGAAHSAESVRHRIRELIDNESPEAILSDDKIVELLRGASIDIARRTVAKYRESMRIASSVERRRQKRMAT